MNREQKAAAIAEIAAQIEQAQAILAVDYRGISVPQAAELRVALRGADTTFRVVKNSLTERAADESGAPTLKPLLTGPTALAFVRGDVATAAKAIADYGRAAQLLPFKGGLMDGATLEVDQIRSLSRLPSRDALYGQLVGMVASPVSGLVRTLGALLGGLAVALGQVRQKMESGEIASAAAPEGAVEPPAEQQAPAEEEGTPAAEATPAETEQQTEPPADQQAPAEAKSAVAELTPAEQTQDESPAQDAAAGESEEQPPAAEAAHAESAPDQAEPEERPAPPQDDDEATPAAAEQPAGDEEKPAKED
jgi:large subunit ribosomal protein L10